MNYKSNLNDTIADSDSMESFIALMTNMVLIVVLWLVFTSNLHAQTTGNAPSNELPTANKTFTLKSSQTLDKVVQDVYKDSPLSYSILRNALLKANPLILSGNPAQRIKVGLTLNIPDHSQLVVQTLNAFVSDADGIDKQGKFYNAAASARRNWVRFP